MAPKDFTNYEICKQKRVEVLRCPCCGADAAVVDQDGYVRDGDALACGCSGRVSADERAVWISPFECVVHSRCDFACDSVKALIEQGYVQHKATCETLTVLRPFMVPCPFCNQTGRATDPKHQMKQANGEPWPEDNCAPCSGNPDHLWLKYPVCTCGFMEAVQHLAQQAATRAEANMRHEAMESAINDPASDPVDGVSNQMSTRDKSSPSSSLSQPLRAELETLIEQWLKLAARMNAEATSCLPNYASRLEHRADAIRSCADQLTALLNGSQQREREDQRLGDTRVDGGNK